MGTVGDGNAVMRGRLGMDSKFAGMDGDGDKSSSPCRSLDGWAVTFGTARSGLGWLRPRLVLFSLYQM